MRHDRDGKVELTHLAFTKTTMIVFVHKITIPTQIQKLVFQQHTPHLNQKPSHLTINTFHSKKNTCYLTPISFHL